MVDDVETWFVAHFKGESKENCTRTSFKICHLKSCKLSLKTHHYFLDHSIEYKSQQKAKLLKRKGKQDQQKKNKK